MGWQVQLPSPPWHDREVLTADVSPQGCKNVHFRAINAVQWMGGLGGGLVKEHIALKL